MIIGRGDIASVITDRDDRLYFASGVSNSQEVRDEEYQREIDLLLKQDRKQHLVYFSSLCVFYANSRYARHKMEVEKLIRENFERYAIVRLGNITWGQNPHTLINFFRNKLKNKEEIEIKPVYRYIIDQEEFRYWLDMIPAWNCEMNITGQRLLVEDIVQKYCQDCK